MTPLTPEEALSLVDEMSSPGFHTGELVVDEIAATLRAYADLMEAVKKCRRYKLARDKSTNGREYRQRDSALEEQMYRLFSLIEGEG